MAMRWGRLIKIIKNPLGLGTGRKKGKKREPLFTSNNPMGKWKQGIIPTAHAAPFNYAGYTPVKSSNSNQFPKGQGAARAGSRGYSTRYSREDSRGDSRGDSKKDESSSQLEKQRKAQEKALMKLLASQRAQAEGSYKTGQSQLDLLMSALVKEFEASRGRLETQKKRGLEEFGEEKGKDLARLQSFYANIGTGDSEQAAQATERTQGTYSKRFQGLEESFGNNFADLESRRGSRKAALEGQRLELGNLYRGTLGDIDAQRYQGRADIENNISTMIQNLRDYRLKERGVNLDELRTQYQINRPYAGGGKKAQTGNYYSRYNPATRTNEYIYTDPVGNENVISADDFMQGKYGVGIGQLGGGGVGFNQGQQTNRQNVGGLNIQYDENGQPYIEF